MKGAISASDVGDLAKNLALFILEYIHSISSIACSGIKGPGGSTSNIHGKMDTQEPYGEMAGCPDHSNTRTFDFIRDTDSNPIFLDFLDTKAISRAAQDIDHERRIWAVKDSEHIPIGATRTCQDSFQQLLHIDITSVKMYFGEFQIPDSTRTKRSNFRLDAAETPDTRNFAFSTAKLNETAFAQHTDGVILNTSNKPVKHATEKMLPDLTRGTYHRPFYTDCTGGSVTRIINNKKHMQSAKQNQHMTQTITPQDKKAGRKQDLIHGQQQGTTKAGPHTRTTTRHDKHGLIHGQQQQDTTKAQPDTRTMAPSPRTWPQS